MTKRAKEKILYIFVGLFVVAAAAAALYLVTSIAGRSLGIQGEKDSYRVQVHFQNIGGLLVGARVAVGGVQVGRVASLYLDKQFNPIVELELYKNMKFPKDTSAAIYSEGILGGQYVGLLPGGDKENLAAGDDIYDTQSAVSLEGLIQQFISKPSR